MGEVPLAKLLLQGIIIYILIIGYRPSVADAVLTIVSAMDFSLFIMPQVLM